MAQSPPFVCVRFRASMALSLSRFRLCLGSLDSLACPSFRHPSLLSSRHRMPTAVGITTHIHRPLSPPRASSLRERRPGLFYFAHLRTHARTSHPPFNILSSAVGAVFSLEPLHLANIFIGLFCVNHVMHRFGKGTTPARYRFTAHDVLFVGSDI